MTLEDDYNILKIKKTASIDQIKQAYRDRAKKIHPDKNLEENKEYQEKKFKKLSNAYQNILDYRKNEDLSNTVKINQNLNRNPQNNTDFNREFGIPDMFDRIIDSLLKKSEILNKKPRNLNSCSFDHDLYTICLKCRNI